MIEVEDKALDERHFNQEERQSDQAKIEGDPGWHPPTSFISENEHRGKDQYTR